jgi:dihydrodipicolinate synthase/N-acetylneuraminate lyase
MGPGVYPAAVTPHRRDGHEADFGAMLELVDFLGRSGAQGVCLLDSTGEFLNIRISDRIRLVHLAVKRSRVPIIAGVSHSTLDGAVEMASEAIGSDAAALLLMPPYFFRYDQDDVAEFYEQFAAQLPSRVPILLDHQPGFTTAIEIPTVRRLMATGRFAGIRTSDTGAGYLERLLELRGEMGFTVFTGSERGYAEARRRGIAGMVSQAAGLVPELFVALERAIAAGDAPRAELLECRAAELAAWIEQFPEPVAVKTALALRNLKTGPLSVPLPPAKDAILIEFQRWFPSWLESLIHVT